MESLTQLIIATDLGFISVEELNDIRNHIEEIAKMWSGLRKSLLSKISN